MHLQSVEQLDNQQAVVYIASEQTNWEQLSLPPQALEAIRYAFQQKTYPLLVALHPAPIFVTTFELTGELYRTLENARMSGAAVCNLCNTHKIANITLYDTTGQKEALLAFAEGLALANYQFLKYRKDADKVQHSLKTIQLVQAQVGTDELAEMQHLMDAIYQARDCINEPLSHLTAEQFAERVANMGKAANFKVKVLGKKQIAAERMGGLLAVNRGSQDPPTFSVLEWKPKNAVNKHPIVLIGKGVMFDTGGLSLKPTANGMDYMKCDMAGRPPLLPPFMWLPKTSCRFTLSVCYRPPTTGRAKMLTCRATLWKCAAV